MDLKTIVKMGLKMTVDVVDPIILSRLSSYSSVPLPLSTNFSLFSLYSYKSSHSFAPFQRSFIELIGPFESPSWLRQEPKRRRESLSVCVSMQTERA